MFVKTINFTVSLPEGMVAERAVSLILIENGAIRTSVLIFLDRIVVNAVQEDFLNLTTCVRLDTTSLVIILLLNVIPILLED